MILRVIMRFDAQLSHLSIHNRPFCAQTARAPLYTCMHPHH
ncbi:phenylalanine-4-hydroxylase [Burkholderia pseudomallei MSHR5613]|nr:phenylalanine-4-hydroxylase [Burkholderia pseudomallei MSHR5613]